jgi:hypothetical protein
VSCLLKSNEMRTSLSIFAWLLPVIRVQHRAPASLLQLSTDGSRSGKQGKPGYLGNSIYTPTIPCSRISCAQRRPLHQESTAYSCLVQQKASHAETLCPGYTLQKYDARVRQPQDAIDASCKAYWQACTWPIGEHTCGPLLQDHPGRHQEGPCCCERTRYPGLAYLSTARNVPNTVCQHVLPSPVVFMLVHLGSGQSIA